MTALESCSDLNYPVNVLRQCCVKVSIVCAFLVGLVCCKVCRQLDSCVLEHLTNAQSEGGTVSCVFYVCECLGEIPLYVAREWHVLVLQ